MNKNALVGIDIGGTKIALALETIDGNSIASRRLPTGVERGPFQVIENIIQAVREMLEDTQLKPLAIGIGCPAPLDIENGIVNSPANMPDWDAIPLVRLIEESFNVKTVLDNDANVAALGEYRYGAGRGFKNILYVTISTGIGGAIIHDGKIIHGLAGGAGEIGHTIVVANDGDLCGCGTYGCLETIASGKNIARRVQERLANGEASLLSEMINGNTPVTTRQVVKAVRRNDELACSVWNEACRFIAIGIGNAINLFAPEAVVIGGGVSAAGEVLLAPIREELKRNIKMCPVEEIVITRAALEGDSGVCGALVLAREAYLKQENEQQKQIYTA